MHSHYAHSCRSRRGLATNQWQILLATWIALCRAFPDLPFSRRICGCSWFRRSGPASRCDDHARASAAGGVRPVVRARYAARTGGRGRPPMRHRTSRHSTCPLCFFRVPREVSDGQVCVGSPEQEAVPGFGLTRMAEMALHSPRRANKLIFINEYGRANGDGCRIYQTRKPKWKFVRICWGGVPPRSRRTVWGRWSHRRPRQNTASSAR